MAIKIFIDQGHNYSDFNTGAEGFGLREQDITFNVGMMLADLLRNDGRFQVMTSRTSPTENLGTNNNTSLATRVRMANNWGADYFISIHVNANVNPAINGTEVYVYRKDSSAYYMGDEILNAVVEAVGTKNNGLRLNPTLYVLRNTNMPAVLVEMAYVTNESDAEQLRDNQALFAQGIYNGIVRYLF